MFLTESFTPIRDILLLHVLRLQVLKLLTAVEVQEEVVLIFRHLQLA